jgi:hypothetical protein
MEVSNKLNLLLGVLLPYREQDRSALGHEMKEGRTLIPALGTRTDQDVREQRGTVSLTVPHSRF